MNNGPNVRKRRKGWSMPKTYDEDEILTILNNHIEKAHWFGEGVGGSGHMATVYPSMPSILSVEDTIIKDKHCVKILYSYDIIRESEFGGTVNSYKKELILDATMNVVSEKEIDHRVRRLLEPPEEPVEESFWLEPEE